MKSLVSWEIASHSGDVFEVCQSKIPWPWELPMEAGSVRKRQVQNRPKNRLNTGELHFCYYRTSNWNRIAK